MLLSQKPPLTHRHAAPHCSSRPRSQPARASANGSSPKFDKLQFWNILPAPGSCPFAQRGWIALEEKEIVYDTHLIDKSNKSKAFLGLFQSIWPDPDKSATVPTLVDTDGTRLTESVVVVEYLDAKYPDQGSKLIPTDPAQAAKARLFVEVFFNSFTKKSSAVQAADSPEALVEAKRGLVAGMQVLEEYLKAHGSSAGPFFCGDSYTIAELLVAPFLASASIILPHYRNVNIVDQANELGLSRLAEWVQAVLDRPSTRATSLPADIRIEYGKARIGDLKVA